MPTIKEILDLIISWSKLKCRIEKDPQEEVPYFKKREIWWVHLGQNIGSEQHGKNEQFNRPVLILKKFNSKTVLILPLTTTEKEGQYYYPTSHEANQKQAKIILSQLRTISTKRLIKKQRTLPKSEFEEVRGKLKSMI